MPRTEVMQSIPRKETGSKRKEHYRQLWREARNRKKDICPAVFVPEIKQNTSKKTTKIEQDSYESIYKPKNLPTHYNLHKKIIKIVPGKYRSKPQKKFVRAKITQICDNIFRCNTCGQMWSVNRKTFSYRGDWWRCRNGCNKDA